MSKEKNLKDSTPLMRQYFEIKSKYPDTILLYRMGDFYETFDEDARTVHKILGITLTKRANGKAAHVALAGFPHHSLESYLPKLIRKGFRVAVCEQVEDPKTAKGIVRRDVIEVVTPGTTMSDKILDQKTNNYIAALISEPQGDAMRFGLAIADASTGEFLVGEVDEKTLFDQLHMFMPAEVVVPMSMADAAHQMIKKLASAPLLTRQEDWLFSESYAGDILPAQFKTHSLKGFGVESFTIGLVAAGALLHYLKDTQRTEVAHINSMRRLDQSDTMTLDRVTLRNLEIVQPSHEGYSHGSLFAILDHTQTAMGGRRLKQWITRPLLEQAAIRARHDAVEELVKQPSLQRQVADVLKGFTDLERLLSKVCAGRVNPRELRGVGYSLDLIPQLKTELEKVGCATLKTLRDSLIDMTPLVDEIQKALNDNPPVQIKEGDIIRKGYDEKLDNLRSIAFDGKTHIANIQQRERERTGIPSLKVQFNNVFGYYIEVTHTHKDKVPQDYIRKQTMVNAERFITPELKDYEEKVLTAEEQIQKLEAELFDQLRTRVAKSTSDIQKNALLISELDCYVSFAEAAILYRYTRPVVTTGYGITIKNGRHPVVERILPPDEPFIPNDVTFDEEGQIQLITGPNMAGKSCYLRQVGLIVLLAQVGSFVPAESADIGIVDKIFTRVGASDNLAAGESTFLVEMNETANILHNATSRSLILLDEIGRGTSTFDGLSIAWAITEHLHERNQPSPKTLFATHYHELVDLEDLFPRVKNYNMQVRKYEDKIIFVRKIARGGCDHSFGIEVAQLAGLPGPVIQRAREVMKNLESHNISAHKEAAEPGARQSKVQITLFDDPVSSDLKEQLSAIDVNSLTPLEALNKLQEMKRLLNGNS